MFDLGAWWDRLADAMQHPAFHAALLALLIGLALTEALAHMLPEQLAKKVAEKVIRAVVAIVVMLVGYRLHPTTIGAGWALCMALMAPSVHHHLQAWAYRRWPKLRPRALR